jgi:tRNA (guanine-N7-)-methyltransferase
VVCLLPPEPPATLDEDPFAPEFELRSFGRRRGRKLSPTQARLLADVLPVHTIDLGRPAPSPLTDLFKPALYAVWLEIGFGGAEHLIAQAKANPTVGLIGCEPFEEGVIKALGGIEAHGLDNVRVHPDDARDVLRWLPEASIDRAFVLFPDPWPKKKHQKRRLVNRQTLAALARVMKPGAELRIGTDIGDYVRSMMIEIAAEGSFAWLAARPDDWRVRPADWPETRYEQKAHREGRRCHYFQFRRRSASR